MPRIFDPIPDYATVQMINHAWLACDLQKRQEITRLYQDICQSGIFNISRQQFLYYCLQLDTTRPRKTLPLSHLLVE